MVVVVLVVVVGGGVVVVVRTEVLAGALTFAGIFSVAFAGADSTQHFIDCGHCTFSSTS